MLVKRIIPCLDVYKGRVVKGIKFRNLRDAGDPAILGSVYSEEGADELVYLDITASSEDRSVIVDVVRKVAKSIDIPFTVGGGINSVETATQVLTNGADKISINTAAVKSPGLITDLRDIFGSNCVVVAIDAKRNLGVTPSNYEVYIYGGSVPTGLDVVEWAKKVVEYGAGEILLTSIDHDGTKKGFDLELTKMVSEAVNVPVIASGGAGNIKHFIELFKKTDADAGLAASIFHFGEVSIRNLKEELRRNGIPVRL